MKMSSYKIISFILLSTIGLAAPGQWLFAQSYITKQYRVEDGLNTDMVKVIAQDSLGFIWIGSDEGLVRYDGNNFTSFPGATPSPYIKSFLKTSNGSLLCLSDLGITKINNLIDTVIFETLFKGERLPKEGHIWYPKAMIEDSKGRFWISEPQSVTCIVDGNLKRYHFEAKDNTTSFVRSFSIAETNNGEIIISSHTGNFYRYDAELDAFIPLKINIKTDEINCITYTKGKFLIGARDGLFMATILNADELHIELISKQIKRGNHILPINHGHQFLVTTHSNKMFVLTEDGDQYKISIVDNSFGYGNHLLQDNDNNIWMSSEKGIYVLQPSLFTKLKTPHENMYIESLALDHKRKTVYFSSKDHVFSYDIAQDTVVQVRHDKGGYYINLAYNDNGLWASNASNILKIENKEIASTMFFHEDGRLILSMISDKHNNIWFTQEAFIGVKKILPDYQVIRYGIEQGIDVEASVVREGPDGMYCGTEDPEKYLNGVSDRLP